MLDHPVPAVYRIDRNPTYVAPRGDFNGFEGRWEIGEPIEITGRGTIVRLGRKSRLVVGSTTWDGYLFRAIELRRWHDGSISVEREVER